MITKPKGENSFSACNAARLLSRNSIKSVWVSFPLHLNWYWLLTALKVWNIIKCFRFEQDWWNYSYGDMLSLTCGTTSQPFKLNTFFSNAFDFMYLLSFTTLTDITYVFNKLLLCARLWYLLQEWMAKFPCSNHYNILPSLLHQIFSYFPGSCVPFLLTIVMVSSVCQLNSATGCPEIWSNITLVSLRECFWKRLICKSVGWVVCSQGRLLFLGGSGSCNQLKARKE